MASSHALGFHEKKCTVKWSIAIVGVYRSAMIGLQIMNLRMVLLIVDLRNEIVEFRATSGTVSDQS